MDHRAKIGQERRVLEQNGLIAKYLYLWIKWHRLNFSRKNGVWMPSQVRSNNGEGDYSKNDGKGIEGMGWKNRELERMYFLNDPFMAPFLNHFWPMFPFYNP